MLIRLKYDKNVLGIFKIAYAYMSEKLKKKLSRPICISIYK